NLHLYVNESRVTLALLNLISYVIFLSVPLLNVSQLSVLQFNIFKHFVVGENLPLLGWILNPRAVVLYNRMMIQSSHRAYFLKCFVDISGFHSNSLHCVRKIVQLFLSLENASTATNSENSSD
ncbi:hypothetical protein PENTCL1PPCAC_21710, partial [Pristionchus entomophagus]